MPSVTAVAAAASHRSEVRRSGRRWIVGLMLFAAAVLNYTDRSLLGIVAPAVQVELGISDARYAWIANAFLVAYTVSYLLSGRLVDRIGSRWSLSVFICIWSVANTLTGTARSVGSLLAYRFCLGLGEAGGYTSSPKAVSEWFRPSERALAVGLYSLGGSVGATVAPLLVAATASGYGWRGAFVVTGVLGCVWIGPWLWLTRPASAARADAQSVSDEPPSATPVGPAERSLWASLLRAPVVWRLMTARLLTDAVWYFYLFWMPKYLATSWGVTQEHMGVMFYVFLGADIGFLGGGYWSGRLVRKGALPQAARIAVMTAAVCLPTLSAAVPSATHLWAVIVLASLIAVGHCAWLGNISTIVVDLMPADRLATAFGLIAAGSAVGGIVMNSLVAWAVGRYSYDSAFYAMAVLHPLALLVVLPLRRAGRRPLVAETTI